MNFHGYDEFFPNIFVLLKKIDGSSRFVTQEPKKNDKKNVCLYDVCPYVFMCAYVLCSPDRIFSINIHSLY